jgi:hypothetical protein
MIFSPIAMSVIEACWIPPPTSDSPSRPSLLCFYFIFPLRTCDYTVRIRQSPICHRKRCDDASRETQSRSNEPWQGGVPHFSPRRMINCNKISLGHSIKKLQNDKKIVETNLPNSFLASRETVLGHRAVASQ